MYLVQLSMNPVHKSINETHKKGCAGDISTVAQNTLLYIQVEQAIFGLSNDDEYEVTATNDKEDIKKLISIGFEYI